MKTLEEMIAVMQAAKDGKTIEYRRHDFGAEWKDIDTPGWNWNVSDYRVKPSPKLVPRTVDDLPKGAGLWIRMYPNEGVYAVSNYGRLGIQALSYRSDVFEFDKPSNLEISADRINWLPWWKEVEA